MTYHHLRTADPNPRRTRAQLGRRGFLALTLGVGAAGGLSACGSAGGVGLSSTDTIKWAWQLPTSWDPIRSSAGSDVHMLNLTYACLTTMDDEGAAAPALAASWEYADDGTAVTFTLRDGLTFSDGTPLDSSAVGRSLLRARDDEGSLVAAQLTNLAAVVPVDARRLRLELTGPDYQYPALLSGKTGMVVNPAALDGDVDALATQPAGAGPFVVDSYVQNSKAMMTRNERYWDRDRVSVSRFELYPAADGATVVAALQSGQFNVALIPPNQVEAAEKAGLRVQVISSMAVACLDVNTRMEPLTDPAVVEAMNYAIDRRAIVDTAQFGTSEVAYQHFPPGYVGYSDGLEDLYPYDPDKARQILADAGHDGDLEVTLSSQVPAGVPEIIQAQLAEVGITATIESVPAARFTELVYVQHSKALCTDYFAGRESPAQAFQVLFGDGGLMNIGGGTSPEVTDAVDAVRRTPLDDPDYPRLLQAATEAAAGTRPNIFLYTQPRIIASNRSVSPVPEGLVHQRFEGVTVS